MTLDDTLRGRTERRLPIMVVVQLAKAPIQGIAEKESTFTHDISSRGARVFSSHPWQAGEVVMLTSLQEGSVCGKVIYCQRLEDNRYAIGLHVPDRPITWSVLQRFWGNSHLPPAQ